MKVLHLTLKKKWFDMIASGEKKEEYREIKPYWVSRLVEEINPVDEKTDESFDWRGTGEWEAQSFTFYDLVTFSNGYSTTSPKASFLISDITTGFGKSEWGAEPDKKYFVIKLGDRIDVH